MKKIIVTLALSAILMATFAFTNFVTFSVNVEESNITWVGKKITYDHTGTIKISSGSLDITGDKLAGGSFTIDMNSMINLDLEDAEKNGQLLGHLKSADFFNVSEFPTAKMVITSAKMKKAEGSNYEVTGDLTIKGITKPVTFPAMVNIDKDIVTANATIVFDRSEYDVRYGSGSFFDDLGDKVIYDDIELGVELIANK
ncbi:MAG: YceI family protein [Saprospiraceae bacterium]|nr:YceI family protein [Saprospiraceae bacterium]